MKKSVLSGIQPSNQLHIGNYLGAVRNWLPMSEEYDCYFLMVDLHGITVTKDPKEIRTSSYSGIATYLAAGLDPNKVSLFLQSHVSAHAELAWIMNCFSYLGELNRMTQFKDKSAKAGKNIGAGLFTYPCLMAADILLYQPDFVPVGSDQKQHIELTRNIAERMNNRFEKELFKIPEPMIGTVGARVMDLQDPTSKMSKSTDNPKGIVFMNDSDKAILKKFKSAVTDSGSEVSTYEVASPGVRNLLDIYCALSGKMMPEVEAHFQGKMYGHLKVETGELCVEVVAPIREKIESYMNDLPELDRILKLGCEKASVKARQTLSRVYDAVGFVPPIM